MTPWIGTSTEMRRFHSNFMNSLTSFSFSNEMWYEYFLKNTKKKRWIIIWSLFLMNFFEKHMRRINTTTVLHMQRFNYRIRPNDEQF